MSWLIQRGVNYYIGYREGTKDKYKSTGLSNKEAAETRRLEFDLMQRRQAGEEVKTSPEMLIDDVIELYKKDDDVKPRTEELADYAWTKFKEETKLTHVGEVTTELIAEFRDDMLEDDYSNATVSMWLRNVKKLFRFAKDQGIIYRDPAQKIELPDEDVVFRFYTPDEEKRILDQSGDLIKRIIIVGFETGLRVTQIIETDWRNYVPNTQLYHVDKQKRQRARYIPISPRALESMGRPRLVGRVFPDDLNRDVVARLWKRALAAAEIEGRARFHDIRHTYVSRVCKVLTPTEVRDLMGWCSVEMVDRYTHSRVSDIQAKLGHGTSVLSLVTTPSQAV